MVAIFDVVFSCFGLIFEGVTDEASSKELDATPRHYGRYWVGRIREGGLS